MKQRSDMPVRLFDESSLYEEDDDRGVAMREGGYSLTTDAPLNVDRQRPSLVSHLVRKSSGSPQREKRSYCSTTKLDREDQSLESFANLDHGRSQRTGFPEAVFAEGKTAEQVGKILDDMARNANESDYSASHGATAILATRYGRLRMGDAENVFSFDHQLYLFTSLFYCLESPQTCTKSCPT